MNPYKVINTGVSELTLERIINEQAALGFEFCNGLVLPNGAILAVMRRSEFVPVRVERTEPPTPQQRAALRAEKCESIKQQQKK